MSVYPIGYLHTPTKGQKYNLRLYISQTPLGIGCSYSEVDSFDFNMLFRFLGEDAKLALKDKNIDYAVKVSILDSMYGELFPMNKKYMRTEEFKGDYSEKNKWRTEIVINEVVRLIGKSKKLHRLKVLNIGVVSSFVNALKKQGYEVMGADFNKTVADDELGGVNIADGNKSSYMIQNSDLVIATGMTIATRTIDKIIEECKKHQVKLIIFAETGHNFASYYIKKGVDVYLREHFPFYSFTGNSTIDICVRE